MKRPTLLLADDHRIVAEGLKRLLEPEFDLVGVVEDGRSLLSAAQDLKPDVIVSDISMPELNGLEALEELKKINPGVRVVFLTMHHNAAYARRATDAGALGYVVKHSAADELVLAVRAAVAGHSFISPAIAGEVLQSLRAGDGSHDDPLRKLTLRHREILRLLVEGHSAKTIAARLDLSPRTVEYHKYTMMENLGISTTAELIRFALQSGAAES
jgi:DNA-binding NarL/FixJ family response regulator